MDLRPRVDPAPPPPPAAPSPVRSARPVPAPRCASGLPRPEWSGPARPGPGGPTRPDPHPPRGPPAAGGARAQASADLNKCGSGRRRRRRRPPPPLGGGQGRRRHRLPARRTFTPPRSVPPAASGAGGEGAAGEGGRAFTPTPGARGPDERKDEHRARPRPSLPDPARASLLRPPRPCVRDPLYSYYWAQTGGGHGAS